MPTGRRPSVTIEFNDLVYTVPDTVNDTFSGFGTRTKKTKKILKNVSGIFKPGLTAIMGPSGAGKSSLMNILAGYRSENVQGSIYVNGKPRDLSTFRKMSSYVMQFDVHFTDLTVIESMRYATQLKLPRTMSKEQRNRVLMEILDDIGLMECKDVTAGKISGGQRKRLSIALELINNPPIMWLDEPTSGLDSSSCLGCVMLLKKLAQGGRTVVCTIHQPSAKIIEQFEHLYLLGEGHNLYRGPVTNIVPFMSSIGLHCPESHNPADFVIEVAIGDYGRQWLDILTQVTSKQHLDYDPRGLTKTNSSFADTEALLTTDKINNEILYNQNNNNSISNSMDFSHSFVTCDDEQDSSWTQFSHQFVTLLKRSALCVSRDMVLTHQRFAATIFSGLMVSVAYHEVGRDANKCFHNAGNQFFSILFMVVTAMMTTVLTFPLERGVLVREHLNSWYSIKSYYLARTMADLPFQIFFPVFSISLMYYSTGQSYEFFRFLLVCLIGVLLSLVAQSIGLLIGAVCEVESAIFVGPVLAIPVFLLSGCFMDLNAITIYIRWMSWFSYAKYAFQSTLTAIYGFERDSLDCFVEYCHFKNPKKFLEMANIPDVSVGQQILCLTAMFIVIRVIAYFALRFKIKSQLY